MSDDNKKTLNNYKTVSTSQFTAVIEPYILSETATTRRIVKSTIIENNPNDLEECLKISITHQRKKTDGSWENFNPISLTALKSNEEVALNLSSKETLVLFHKLEETYAVAKKGVRFGTRELVVGNKDEVIVTDRNKSVLIQQLLAKNYHHEILKQLITESSDVITKFSTLRVLQERTKVLKEFEININDTSLSESYWQNFFEINKWIFGYGLNYQILKDITDQPNYGNTSVDGKGSQRGDFLSASQGDIQFTVLVEIKKPSTELLGKNEYRNGCYAISTELAGAIGQLQTNCRTWDQTSQQVQNIRQLDPQQIRTIQCKGILVIGRLSTLDHFTKEASFQLVRRNLLNPEIITFDELLNRARYIIEHSNAESVAEFEKSINT